MSKRRKLYFATDLHGSEKCFRKFLNAGPAYGADALILGGDVAGKAIQGIVRQPGGRFRCEFRGAVYDLEDGEDLPALERLIGDHGYYSYRAEPGELEGRKSDGSLDDLFLTLMRERLSGWLSMAEERLRPQGLPLYFMLGNDDPPALKELLDQAPWGEHAEGRVMRIDGHEMLSLGYSNITPWNSYREMTEEQLATRLGELAGELEDPTTAIFNVHVPPYGTGLDEAPALDSELRVQQALGQVKFGAVGSTAVREALERYQPLLGLHGHIHESAGFRKLGRTVAINPGSDYGTGALNGTLVTLEPDRVRAHQFVRG
jgi:uncharacterized protein